MKVFNNKKLIELRLKKGISRGKMTMELYKYKDKGIVPQTLKKWEEGLACPNFNNVLLISDFFQVPITIFIKETK
tara:strand:+ start:263 stop:487 length:225 start_codon:yes stop_codon:yes gene_type:complete